MDKKPSTKIIFMTELVIFVSISILCAVSVLNVRAGIHKAIQQRMLDIANCASGSINGDILKRLTAEDADTPEYRSVYDELAIFRDNVELEFVYGIKDEGNGHFTFTVDPALEDAAPFGGEVKYTEALATAAKGIAAVDEVPYTDDWGSFYSAYSPVFDSSGKVAGIIAVDFSVEWFESQLVSQTRSTIFTFVLLLMLILIIAGSLSMIVVAPFVRKMEQLSKAVEENANENEKLLLQITQALTDAIDEKDAYTRGHSRRVAEYSKMIAWRLGYSEDAQNRIYMMGLLHDVGKIGVPDGIINKPARLTDKEFELIKEHPAKGERILKNITSRPELAAVARWHHEKIDGTGYPDNKMNEEIPEEARIVAVADAYDAMTSNRSYRKAMPQKAVRAEIEAGKGKQFDPVFADIMLELIDKDTLYQMREI